MSLMPIGIITSCRISAMNLTIMLGECTCMYMCVLINELASNLHHYSLPYLNQSYIYGKSSKFHNLNINIITRLLYKAHV